MLMQLYTLKNNVIAVASNFLEWVESLQQLLSDPNGLDLFQEYLEQEDPGRFLMLKFWFACRAIPEQHSQYTSQCIRVIYE